MKVPGKSWTWLANQKRQVDFLSSCLLGLLSCLIRNTQTVFKQSAALEAETLDILAIEYNRIHALAKDAIHLVEGLDAVLRSLECAIRAHAEMDKRDVAIWQATQDALHHRREMFHSTKLRLSSIDQRLKNVINLVRHPFTSLFGEAPNHRAGL
jgi:hypothetical protein